MSKLLALAKPSSGIQSIAISKILYRSVNMTLCLKFVMHFHTIYPLTNLKFQSKEVVRYDAWYSSNFKCSPLLSGVASRHCKYFQHFYFP